LKRFATADLGIHFDIATAPPLQTLDRHRQIVTLMVTDTIIHHTDYHLNITSTQVRIIVFLLLQAAPFFRYYRVQMTLLDVFRKTITGLSVPPQVTHIILRIIDYNYAA